MPGSDHETALARQWEMLRNHLPSRPLGRTSRDLRDRMEAAGHNVTKRTIERDMQDQTHMSYGQLEGVQGGGMAVSAVMERD